MLDIDIIYQVYYETHEKDLEFLGLKSGGEGEVICFLLASS